MKRFDWEFTDVLDRSDLRALLDEFTPSNGRSGFSAKWHCPDPDDQNPSVTMSTDSSGRERWRCWSGDHRGDAIDLVSTVHRVDALEAAGWLAGRAGMAADRPLPPPVQRAARRSEAPPELSRTVHRFVSVAEAVLRGPQGQPMRQWLLDRGIDENTWKANRIGADLGRDVMPRRSGLPHGAGPGIVLPAFDNDGKVTYVQTRYLDAEAAGYKYDNPARYLGANPRLTMIQPTPEKPTRESAGSGCPSLVVTEGIPDGLVAAQAGFAAAALLGAQTPDGSVAVRIAARADHLGADVILAIDADLSGSQAIEALVELLGRHGVEPRVIDLPEGYDLNDWALDDPDWRRALVADVDLAPSMVGDSLMRGLEASGDVGLPVSPSLEREGPGREL